MSDLGIDKPNPNRAEQLAHLLELGRDVDAADCIRDMIQKIPNARALILAEAFRCLGATRYYFDRKEGRMVHEPDFKVRLDAARLLIAYADGLPIQTSLTVAVGDTKDAALDLEAAVSRSPALRERLQKLVGPWA